MTSALAVKQRSGLRAEPRYFVTPEVRVSLGDEAAAFAKKAGLVMDPWQADVLDAAMGIRRGGVWASRSVGLLVPRQNGKGSILEARELYAMFAGDERLIIHSAHRYDTSQLHFQRLLDLIEGNPDLDRHIQQVSKIVGKETIKVKREDGTRCELKFKARTLSGSGRGFSCDLLVLDESFLLPEEALAAMLPTLAARRNPQIWYTSSAGYPTSRALWRVVNRGRAGDLGTYIEYGCPLDADPADRENWERANPGLDVRLSRDLLEDNFALMLPEDFAREHLGMWDETVGGVISAQKWAAACDRESKAGDSVAFAVDTTPDRGMTAIAVAGERPDGLIHVEVVDHRPGTEWVVERLLELQRRWWPDATLIDPSSAAGSLIPDLKAAGVDFDEVTIRGYAQACGQFYDAVMDSGTLRHLGQPELDAAVANAAQRPLSDAWAWSRKNAAGDISPLCAVTLALSGYVGNQPLSPNDIHIVTT
jgi:phage terminase large subunit-like protein